jgi:hypothetical protein
MYILNRRKWLLENFARKPEWQTVEKKLRTFSNKMLSDRTENEKQFF